MNLGLNFSFQDQNRPVNLEQEAIVPSDLALTSETGLSDIHGEATEFYRDLGDLKAFQSQMSGLGIDITKADPAIPGSIEANSLFMQAYANLQAKSNRLKNLQTYLNTYTQARAQNPDIMDEVLDGDPSNMVNTMMTGTERSLQRRSEQIKTEAQEREFRQEMEARRAELEAQRKAEKDPRRRKEIEEKQKRIPEGYALPPKPTNPYDAMKFNLSRAKANLRAHSVSRVMGWLKDGNFVHSENEFKKRGYDVVTDWSNFTMTLYDPKNSEPVKSVDLRSPESANDAFNSLSSSNDDKIGWAEVNFFDITGADMSPRTNVLTDNASKFYDKSLAEINNDPGSFFTSITPHVKHFRMPSGITSKLKENQGGKYVVSNGSEMISEMDYDASDNELTIITPGKVKFVMDLNEDSGKRFISRFVRQNGIMTYDVEDQTQIDLARNIVMSGGEHPFYRMMNVSSSKEDQNEEFRYANPGIIQSVEASLNN